MLTGRCPQQQRQHQGSPEEARLLQAKAGDDSTHQFQIGGKTFGSLVDIQNAPCTHNPWIGALFILWGR